MAKADKKNIAELFKQNPTIAFLAGMALLVVLRLVLAGMGGGASPAEDAQPAVVKLQQKIGPDSVDVMILDMMLKPMPEFQQSDLYPLAQYNMFDPKFIQNADALEKSANDRVAQAQAALAANNLSQARDLARQALGMRPNHAGAQQVLKDIDLKEHPPAVTPTPAGARGAAPGGTPSAVQGAPPGSAAAPGARGAAPAGAPPAGPGAAPGAPIGAGPAPGTPGGAGR